MPYRDFIRTRIKKSHRKLSYNKEKIAMMRAFQPKSFEKATNWVQVNGFQFPQPMKWLTGVGGGVGNVAKQSRGSF